MTVPEILIRKWTKIFHYRDTDKDGIAKEKNFQRYAENFVKTYGERALPVREVSKILWSTMTAKDYKPEVTLEEYLDSYKYQWLYERHEMEKKLTRYANLCFDAIDSDGGGTISIGEYTVYQNSFDIKNQDYIDHIFHRLDRNGDGTISRDEFLEDILDYVLAEAPERIPELYDHKQARYFRRGQSNGSPGLITNNTVKTS